MTAILTTLCLLAVCATSAAQTFTSTADSGNIPDGNGNSVRDYGEAFDMPVVVSGLAGTIDTLNVTFEARHSFVGELQVTLISPQGQEHVLFESTGATDSGRGSPANLVAGNVYTFSDNSTNNWWSIAGLSDSDIPPSNARTVISGGPGATNPPAFTSILDLFQRRAPNGTWILRFRDGWSGNFGGVQRASLTFGVTGATHTVTKIEDTNDGMCDADCSLREAIASSSNGAISVDRIEFAKPFFSTPRRIALTSDLNFIDRPVAIVGPEAPLLTISGRGQHQIDLTAQSTKLSLSGLRITDVTGLQLGAGDIVLLHGVEISHLRGMIKLLGGSEVNDSSIHSNRSEGSVLELESATLRRSTISSNVVFPSASGTPSTIKSQFLTLLDCTITGNQVNGYQATGGVFVGAGNASPIQNTVIAGNRTTGDTPYGDVGGPAGAFVSLGHNLIGNVGVVTAFDLSSDQTGTPTNSLDPKLGPLRRNGGTVPTHAPLRTSPLLDRGIRTGNDVRGVPVTRLSNMGPWQGGNQADIGAVEVNPRLVSQLGDSGDGSLREAVKSLSYGRVIDIWFALDLPPAATILLTSGEINIEQNMAIHGPGARKLTISGNGQSRVIAVNPNQRVSISGLSLAAGNGTGNQSSGLGGILLSREGSQVSLVEMELRDTAANAAWYALEGALSELWGSTISEANAGISTASSTLDVVRSTISTRDFAIFSDQDSAQPASESGIFDSTLSGAVSCGGAGHTFIQNTIVDDEFIGCQNSVTSMGHNLVRNGGNSIANFTGAGDQVGTQTNPIDPRLSPLAYHGGMVPTRVPLAASPALDRGIRLGPQDARGQTRFDITHIDPAIAGDDSDIGAVEAQALYVTNTTDLSTFNPGSLRQAILTADDNGTRLDDVLFDVSGTIALFSKLPTPISNSTINLLGNGADHIAVVRADTAPAFGLMDVVGGGHLGISGITLGNGRDDGSNGGDGVGGALQTNGTDIVLSEVEFVGNSATQGGAVSFANSEVVIQGCAFVGNNATTNAGAVQFLGNGKQLSISNSTFSGNSALQGGSAITHLAVKTPSLMKIESVTLAENSSTTIVTEGFAGGTAITSLRNTLLNNTNNLSTQGTAFIKSNGFNLSNNAEPFLNQSSDRKNANASLAPLQNNGGPTRTHALLPGSAAIDAGIRTGIFDQIGNNRPNDLPMITNAAGSDGTDIGSYEATSETVFSDGFE